MKKHIIMFKVGRTTIDTTIEETGLKEKISYEDKKKYLINLAVEQIMQDIGINVKEIVNVYEDYYIM